MKKKMLSCLAMGAVALFAVGCGTNQLQERKVYGEGYEILKCDMPDEETASTETEGAEVTTSTTVFSSSSASLHQKRENCSELETTGTPE